jgi:hypothetical protein
MLQLPKHISIVFITLLMAITPGFHPALAQSDKSSIRLDFYGDTLLIPFDRSYFVDFLEPLSPDSVRMFYERINETDYLPVVQQLLEYKKKHHTDDWLYYQLIRRLAQAISPKADNYHRYTLYKWFFLSRSGYDATLSISGDRMLFYVQSDDNIYNIPYRIKNGKRYVCLNYHDYGTIDFENNHFTEVTLPLAEVTKSFSYRIGKLPDFSAADYREKDLQFNYYQNNYHFKIKLNPQIQTIFANYPVTDYASHFNIPLSWETYRSLIPVLKKNTKGMSTKNGVDYLMRFTRYAFLFEPDSVNFGKEKRLSPEQTLFYDNSDCEDRAALFFYLVKELYNLPMIVLVYPKHVTVAVKFKKPSGKPVLYNGSRYTICEPTPQKKDLQIGESLPGLRNTPYEVAYSYNPAAHLR